MYLRTQTKRPRSLDIPRFCGEYPADSSEAHTLAVESYTISALRVEPETARRHSMANFSLRQTAAERVPIHVT